MSAKASLKFLFGPIDKKEFLFSSEHAYFGDVEEIKLTAPLGVKFGALLEQAGMDAATTEMSYILNNTSTSLSSGRLFTFQHYTEITTPQTDYKFWGSIFISERFTLSPPITLRSGGTLSPDKHSLESYQTIGVSVRVAHRFGFLLFNLDDPVSALVERMLELIAPDLVSVQAAWENIGGKISRLGGEHPTGKHPDLWIVRQFFDGSYCSKALDHSIPLRKQLQQPDRILAKSPAIIELHFDFPASHFPYEAIVFLPGKSYRLTQTPCGAETLVSEAVASAFGPEFADNLYCAYPTKLSSLADRAEVTLPESWLLYPPMTHSETSHTIVSLFSDSSTQLFVKDLVGCTRTCEIPLDATVNDLKIILYMKLGIDPTEQRLIFGGKQLEDGRVLMDYNIKLSCTLHLVLRLRGSDRHLKHNITLLHAPDSAPHYLPFSWYSFEYRDDHTHRLHQGVMAQEIMADFPQAIDTSQPFLRVDYSLLPLPFELSNQI